MYCFKKKALEINVDSSQSPGLACDVLIFFIFFRLLCFSVFSVFHIVTLRFSKKFQIITSNYMSIIIVWKMRKQSTAEQRKKMKSKRREVSKLSLSIFSPGQFININLFFLFFVLIYIFSPLFPRIKRLTWCFFSLLLRHLAFRNL